MNMEITEAQAKALKKMLGKGTLSKEKELFGFTLEDSEAMTSLWFELIGTPKEKQLKTGDKMRLHSINQENRTAVIDYMGNLVEVSWIYWEGELLLSDYTLVLIERESISYSDTINLIRNHLASAPKHDQEEVAQPNPEDTQYSAYEIDVSDLDRIDIYEICERFKMLDYSGRRHHALKKIILAGTRTGKKPAYKDIKEARDTLTKWLNANG